VSVYSSASSRLPARCAYLSAVAFITASSITNVAYGYGKGDTLVTSLVWAIVAGAVAAVQALSWPAMIRSIDGKRWSAALVALAALTLSGTYSVVAALGSAAGGRLNSATAEQATGDARIKAQAAYDRAQADLDALAAAKPGGELQAQIEAARADLAKIPAARAVAELEALQRGASQRGCQAGTALKGQLKTKCPDYSVETARAWERQRFANKITELTKDAERAEQRHGERRDRAQATMDKAAAELASVRPAKVANSDSKALARYLAATGLEITPDRLNDLLVLLAVLMIETGGGLSLAVGMALSGPAGERTAAPSDSPAGHSDQRRTPPAATLTGFPDSPAKVSGPAVTSRTVRPAVASGGEASDVVAWLAASGGRAEGVRRMAEALGRPRSTVSDECRRLRQAGQITMARGRHGAVVTLAAIGKLN
jgi:hypothetical protein